MPTSWTRGEKFTLIGLVIGVVTCLAAVLVVPEFRKFIGLDTPLDKSLGKISPEAAESSAQALSAESIPEDVLQMLREMMHTKKQIKAISFSPRGGYVVISEKQQKWHGIPDDASDAMREVDGPIKQMAFTPSNGWIILYGKNGWNSQGLPESTLRSLRHLNDKGKSIDMVSFAPGGGWVIVYDNYGAFWEGIPSGLDKKLRKMNANNKINVVAFSPDGGWLLVHDQTAWAYSGIPNRIAERLDELAEANKGVNVVSFMNDGGWIIITDSE